MQPRDYWKLGAIAAGLGTLTISLVPRDPNATIRDVMNDQRSGAVTLEGRIELLRPNRFLLRDGTGEIRLETCPTWYRRLPLQPGERIAVFGNLAPRSRWLLDHPIFVVHRLRRESGEPITLRYGTGAPPWQRETWRSSAVSD